MKGIILAGDTDERLLPITKAIPKQLMPLYDKPMIYYPLMNLISAGIDNILIVTTKRHQTLFKEYLGDGSRFGVNLDYAIQDAPNGIAEAFIIGSEFIDKSEICLITGDTIILPVDILSLAKLAKTAMYKSKSSTIFSYNENSSVQYGKILKGENGKNKQIVTHDIKGNFYDIVGLYFYPNDVVKFAKEVKPSERGRLEITTINQQYFNDNRLQIFNINKTHKWFDTNSFDNILSCSIFIHNSQKAQ